MAIEVWLLVDQFGVTQSVWANQLDAEERAAKYNDEHGWNDGPDPGAPYDVQPWRVQGEPQACSECTCDFSEEEPWHTTGCAAYKAGC